MAQGIGNHHKQALEALGAQRCLHVAQVEFPLARQGRRSPAAELAHLIAPAVGAAPPMATWPGSNWTIAHRSAEVFRYSQELAGGEAFSAGVALLAGRLERDWRSLKTLFKPCTGD